MFDEQLGARLGFSYTQPVAGNTGLTTVTGIGGTTGQGDTDGTLNLNTSAATTAGDVGNISNFGLTSASSGIGMIYDIGITALKGEIYAMQSESLAKVMSNPKVFTLNGIEAKILKGKQIQFTAAEGDMQFKDAGLKLTVTPQIVGDGNVIMELAITNDEVSGTGSNPAISKMEINTKLIVADGSVVAIGGIYTQNESVGASKVPILGDLPGIGRLFRKDTIADTQTQIIIFIAPKIV
jgi:type IV pilus assembly protein PilQ